MYGLAAVGNFKTEWIDSSQIYLSHYMDSSCYGEGWNKRLEILQEHTITRLNKMGDVEKFGQYTFVPQNISLTKKDAEKVLAYWIY
jgi:hypothetical protein